MKMSSNHFESIYQKKSFACRKIHNDKTFVPMNSVLFIIHRTICFIQWHAWLFNRNSMLVAKRESEEAQTICKSTTENNSNFQSMYAWNHVLFKNASRRQKNRMKIKKPLNSNKTGRESDEREREKKNSNRRQCRC